jgi:uncharacterized protein (UPF0248 family)
MNAATRIPVSIEKEQVPRLRFPNEEVLKSKDQMKQRLHDLQRAMTLGNLEHAKIRIVFEDSEGLKQTETTVWGVTDKRIILKQGVVIPIHRIHEVKL